MSFKKFLALILVVVPMTARRADAELVRGVTVFRELISFDSAAPGSVLSNVPITGPAQFESILGLDYRPATGQLYALGNAPGSIYRLYRIDPTTAVATKVGSDITFSGVTNVGFDFNPMVDRIRIVTDNGQNFRYHPDTGALVSTDTPLAYLAGDPNFGATPNIVGAAYSNNVAGALSTTLFDIDASLDILTTQNPANAGSLGTVGALGADFATTLGFDISGLTGNAFASTVNTGGAPTFSNLFSINLQTGAASLVGEIGAGLILNDIALGVAVPEPTSFALALVPLFASAIYRNRRRNHIAR
ncbi:MAG: DUF4394 domain-containing protein [Pirellulaceae bacterium]|nr:DUF4394 domain-containing protein [Pirellulaceae bacterium]